MSDLVLHHTAAAPDPAAGAWRQFTTSLGQVWLGLRDGLEAAHRYERLAAASDAELARLGITREDVPWFAMYGKRRPR
jgi:hypothetical protein